MATSGSKPRERGILGCPWVYIAKYPACYMAVWEIDGEKHQARWPDGGGSAMVLYADPIVRFLFKSDIYVANCSQTH